MGKLVMVKRFVIVVHPAGGRARPLTVEDAMQQVLDSVALLGEASRGAKGTGADCGYTWVLHRASTNSPLTIEIEARPRDDALDFAVVEAAAERDFAEVVSGLATLDAGGPIPDWFERRGTAVAKRLLKRTLNGIGLTELRGADATGPHILIDPPRAERGLATIDLVEAPAPSDLPAHKAFGELVGRIVSVGEYRGRPAIWVRGRDRRDVPCVVTPDRIEEVGHGTTVAEVWRNERVRVRGRKNFGKDGTLLSIIVTEFERAPHLGNVNVDRIIDDSFTGGLSAREYLNRLRSDSDD